MKYNTTLVGAQQEDACQITLANDEGNLHQILVCDAHLLGLIVLFVRESPGRYCKVPGRQSKDM